MAEELNDLELTPEQARQKILDYRRRLADGGEVTDEELKEALLLLRAQRRGAVKASAAKKAKKEVNLPQSKTGGVDLDALFAGVGKKK